MHEWARNRWRVLPALKDYSTTLSEQQTMAKSVILLTQFAIFKVMSVKRKRKTVALLRLERLHPSCQILFFDTIQQLSLLPIDVRIGRMQVVAGLRDGAAA